MNPQLFRKEVIPSDEKLRLGEVVLIAPLPSFLLLSVSGAIFIGLALAIGLGTYTRHVTVQGVIAPIEGVIKLYAPQSGQLRSLAVKEGDFVNAGQVIMVFNTERQTSKGSAVEQEVIFRILEKLRSLRQELDSTHRLQSQEIASLQQALASQLSSRDGLERELDFLGTRESSAQTTVERFENLRKSGYVTEQMAQDKRDDRLDQEIRLQSAQHDLTASLQEIDRLNMELASAPEKHKVACNQIEREISMAESELAVQSAGHEWSLTAPCNCTVTSLDINVGQVATPNVPLVSMVPKNGTLQATLYAPSRALGFVAVGESVELKLDSFPFEEFGAVEGHVQSIATTPLTLSESAVGTHLALPQSDGPQEPMYSIKVSLTRPSIDAYGKPQALRSGMQLSADVQLETRRIYEWMILPLLQGGRS